MQPTKILVLAVAFASLAISGASAEWPEKPVTIIVPWSAGGSTDQGTIIVQVDPFVVLKTSSMQPLVAIPRATGSSE